MTDKQFWQKLADIMKKPQNDVTTIELIQTLLQAGNEDLAILALCVQEKNNPDGACQLYAGTNSASCSAIQARKKRRRIESRFRAMISAKSNACH